MWEGMEEIKPPQSSILIYIYIPTHQGKKKGLAEAAASP